jgi:hypothetical protein
MTKKVLIIGLNYGIESSIALSGRINIAVNARGVFIADYGILEENITYLTDEWAPLTKDQILAAIQALVDESTSLEEIYVYYTGYGSGIRILKRIKYPEVLLPEFVIPEIVIPEPDPIVSYDPSIVSEPPPTDNVVEPADNISIEILPSDTNTDLDTNPTETNVIQTDTNVIQTETNVIQTETNVIQTNVIQTETNVIEPNTINITAVEIPPPTYYYEFAQVYGQYDKLTKQIVGSDYEIIDSNQLLELLGKSCCRTICVLDMCPFDNDSNIMWGTDTIGNVNIISFSESDVYSSGKQAMIRIITSHFYPDV